MRLIDADGIIAKWRAAMLHMVKDSDGRHAISMETLIEDLKKAPTIEAEPVRHGRWIKDRDGDEYCENCSRYMPSREVTGDPSATNYCPNCGSRMDGE